MNYLFFFVHPAKFHVFRISINELKKKGHNVEVLITSKDVLEALVKEEGWDYTNIFPEGRKIKSLPVLLGTGINTVRTLWRLLKYTRKRKYDLFVTDDWLVWIGKIKRIPTLVFTDDDLSVAKQFALILAAATHIIAPEITDLGRFNRKKIGFPGYKELAYLHPNVFHPDKYYLAFLDHPDQIYFILRLVSLNAYHDVGKRGISDTQVDELIKRLEKRGRVFISAERALPKKYEKYRLDINPKHIAHALSFATLFIGDSQTMTSEAAVLGTPSIRCNNFVGKINVMEEKVEKYQLSSNFLPTEFDQLISRAEALLDDPNFKIQFRQNRDRMLADKIDLSAFMIWLLENYQQVDFSKTIDFKKFKLK